MRRIGTALRPSSVCATLVVMSIGWSTLAHADGQIHACVNNSSGEIKLVAQNAACKNNETLVVWNSAGSATLSAAEAFCPTAPNGQPITFQVNGFGSVSGAVIVFTPGASFGSGISTNGSAFNSFVVQPGTYLISLTATEVGGEGLVVLLLNGQPLPTFSLGAAGEQAGEWRLFAGQLAGSDLVQVSAPNTVLQFATVNAIPFVLDRGCRLMIQQLQ